MAIAVSSRYARALADVVAETGADYRGMLRELGNFYAVCQQSAELRELFETPAVALEQKIKVLDTILKRLGASRTATNFLRILVRNYRIRLLKEIQAVFLRIANQRMGVVQVRIASALTLSPIEQDALRERFQELTQKKVEMDFRLDDSLLGGVQAQIQSTIYDGTVRGQLQRIKAELLSR